MSTRAISKSNVVQSFQRFWYWWSGELGGLIPQRLKEATRLRNRLDFIASADALVVEEVVDGKGRRLEEARSLDALDEASWNEIAEFCADRNPRLILSEADFLRIDLKLPRAAAGDLAETVRLQLHLYSPLEPSATDWAVRKIGSSSESVHAALLIARSERIEAIQNLFAEHGLMPPIIAAPLDDVPLILRAPLDLPGDRFGSLPKRIYALAALIVLLVPVITIFAADLMTSANDAQAAEIEARIAPKLAATREAQRAENSRRRLSPIAQAPSAVFILEEVAKRLPENQWLVSANALSDRRVILEVDAPEDGDVTEALAGSPLFRDVNVIDQVPSEQGRAHHQVEAALK